MEFVKKTISLEPYTSRVYGGIPFVGYNAEDKPKSNWGKIVKGIDFTKFSDSDKAKYGNNISLWGKMGYRELMNTYYQLKNRTNDELVAIESTTASRLEESKNQSLIKFVEENKFSVGNEIGFVKCGCPVRRKEEDYSIEFLDDDERFFIPTANISILLTGNSKLIGSYTFLGQEWVPGKRYYIGDTVLYDEQTYVLDSGAFKEKTYCQNILSDASDETKSLYRPGTEVLYYVLTQDELNAGTPEGEEVNFNILDNAFFVLDSVDDIIRGGYTYAKVEEKFYIKPYFSGFLDETTLQIYFDELVNGEFDVKEDGSTTHWRLRNTPYEMSFLKNVSATEGVEIHGDGVDTSYVSTSVTDVTGESKLDEFVRRSKTIDDNRNQLPGKLISSSVSALAPIYSIGLVRNISSGEENIFTGDYLESIAIDGQLFSSDIALVEAIDTMSEGDDGTISFTYYIGCNLTKENDIFVPSTAGSVKHVDTFNYIVHQQTYVIGGEDRLIKYLTINYESGSQNVVLENLDNLEYSTKLSEIEYTTTSTMDGVFNKSPNFVNTPYFMEDYKLGLVHVDNNFGDFVIDRGNAAAFERHLRLSEVRTVQDLEQYGNGFFEVKN